MQTNYPTALNLEKQTELYNCWKKTKNDHYRIKLAISYVSLISAMITKANIEQYGNREDIIMHILSIIYNHIPLYDAKRASIYTYIYRIVLSRIIDCVRKYNREIVYRVDLDDEVLLREMQKQEYRENKNDIYETLYLNDLRDNINKAKEKLNKKQRKIVQLLYFEEKPANNICATIQISRKAYKKELTTIHNILKEQLNGKYK